METEKRIITAEGWYLTGKQKQWGIGTHYNVLAKSVEIPEGLRVKFYENADGSGWQTRWYYGHNTLTETYLYHNDFAGRMSVEATSVKTADCIAVHWRGNAGVNYYQHTLLVPPGAHNAGGIAEVIPNDLLESAEVPEGLTATFFEHGGFQGGNLEFSGKKGGTSVFFADFNWQNVVSSIKVEADEWEFFGHEFLEMIDKITYKTIGGSGTLYNDGQTEAVMRTGIAVDMSESTEQTTENSHEIGASLETKIGTSVGGGIGPVNVEVTAEVTAGVSFNMASSFAFATSHTEGISQTAEVEAPVPPGERYKISMLVNREKGTYRVLKTYRNKQTGETIGQVCRIFVDSALNWEAQITDGTGQIV